MAVNGETLIVERIKDLEQRVKVLEDRDRTSLWGNVAEVYSKENDLVLTHGEVVDKSVAARILGVTRATVYAMLADGRIESACEGARVSVRSIARYIARKEKKYAG